MRRTVATTIDAATTAAYWSRDNVAKGEGSQWSCITSDQLAAFAAEALRDAGVRGACWWRVRA